MTLIEICITAKAELWLQERGVQCSKGRVAMALPMSIFLIGFEIFDLLIAPLPNLINFMLVYETQ